MARRSPRVRKIPSVGDRVVHLITGRRGVVEIVAECGGRWVRYDHRPLDLSIELPTSLQVLENEE